MTFKDRATRFLTRVRAWIRLRRTCVLCGYGIIEFEPGEPPDVPEVYSGIDKRDGEPWRAWCHPSCYDYRDS